MSLVIIAPLAGDTVMSPVTVTTSYEFSSGSFTITTDLTGATPASSGSVTGTGSFSPSMATTATGAVTASSSASPSGGGASSSVTFTIGTGGNPPPIIIETVLPSPPPPPPPVSPVVATGSFAAKAAAPAAAPAGNKKYNVKGSIKNTGVKAVKYSVLQVDLTNLQWTVVVASTDAQVGGNNWHANDVPIVPLAHCQYVVQAQGFDINGNLLGQFTMAVKL